MLEKKERKEAKKSYSPSILNNNRLGLTSNSAFIGVANWLYQK